jgi:hypothetical protein
MVISLTIPQLEKLAKRLERPSTLAQKLVLKGALAEIKDRTHEIDRLAGRPSQPFRNDSTHAVSAAELTTVESIIKETVGE